MRLSFALRARLGDFDFDAAFDGEIDGVSALFGASGAGKSTVLAAIAGFRPELGRIEADGALWQGAPARAVPPHRRPVGLVFQDARLFDHLTVRGNLDFAARRADPGGPAVDRAAVIETLEIAALLGRRPATLSGGERQRVAIARALLARPKLLLLDEPMTGLDRARKARILPMIAQTPRLFGASVIYVSHALEEVAAIADRLIAMRAGRIVGVGPTAEMLASLDADVTGRFEAGAVLSGAVEAYDPEFDVTRVRLEGGGVLTVPGGAPDRIGAPARLRVRARDVSLAAARLEGISIRNQLVATVEATRAEAGPFAEVALRLAGGARLTARLTRAALSELAIEPGRSVVALVKAAALDRRLAAAPMAAPDAPASRQAEETSRDEMS